MKACHALCQETEGEVVLRMEVRKRRKKRKMMKMRKRRKKRKMMKMKQ